MKLSYSKEARQHILALHPEARRGVKTALEGLLAHPWEGKPLARELTGFWSLAFKRYRIIYRIDESQEKILVDAVRPRPVVYEELIRKK